MYVWLVLLLAACGTSPSAVVEPPPLEEPGPPAWCSPHAPALVGHWVDTVTRQGHHYEMNLRIVALPSPCAFAYHYTSHQLADAGHEEALVFESQGQILVVGGTQLGGVVSLEMESRRLYQARFDEAGLAHEDHDTQLYNTSHAKIWGRVLAIWQAQYLRKEDP